MARIISSRKKYVPVKDLVVYPSKTETIEAYLDACKERIDDGEMVEIRIKCTAEKCE